jgi:5'-nucleotidase
MMGSRTAYPVALLVAVLAMLVAAMPASAQKKRKRPPLAVQLLAFNDFHGHLEATTPGTMSRTGDPADRVPAGGAEYFATQVRILRRRNPNTLLVSAGDLIGGSPLLSSLFHDEPTIEAMNKIGLYVNAVGNHEFDEGPAELLRMARGGCHPTDGCGDGTGFAGAKFHFLAANVERRATGTAIFPPYVIRYIDGIPIGFIGLTLKGTPDYIGVKYGAQLRFRDEADTINRNVRRLKRRGVRAIVVLLHEGGFPVRPGVSPDDCPGLSGPLAPIIRRTSGQVDLFLTGHTHFAYNCVIDGRRVTSAGSYGRLITRIELEISRRSRDVRHVSARNWVVGQDVMRAPDITALIERYSHFAAPLRDRVIGRTARRVGRLRDPSGESKMGNLVADGQREATATDAAFVNPGIVRAGLPAGDVTFGRAFMTQPFGTSLVTMTMTGVQLHELLKQQWCGRTTRDILQVSSTVAYSWSATVAKGITGKPCAEAADPVTELRISGHLVQPWEAYRITVNTSLTSRGNHFSILHTGTGAKDGPGDTDALESHLTPSLTGAPVVPPARDRITRVP